MWSTQVQTIRAALHLLWRMQEKDAFLKAMTITLWKKLAYMNHGSQCLIVVRTNSMSGMASLWAWVNAVSLWHLFGHGMVLAEHICEVLQPGCPFSCLSDFHCLGELNPELDSSSPFSTVADWTVYFVISPSSYLPWWSTLPAHRTILGPFSFSVQWLCYFFCLCIDAMSHSLHLRDVYWNSLLYIRLNFSFYVVQ